MDTINLIKLLFTVSLEEVKDTILNAAINYKTAPDVREV